MDPKKTHGQHLHHQIDKSTIFGVVRAGTLDEVKEFIEKNGKDVIESFDPDGYSLIHWSAFNSSIDVFSYLIEIGAEFDNFKSNNSGQRPIHWACVRGRIDVINILIEKGVDVNCQDSKGFTPLITATQYNQLALVCYLVNRGAKLEIEDSNGDTALHWAAYKGLPDLTRLLIIYGIDPKKIDLHGQSLLHLACISGNLNIVQHLISQDNLDPEIRDKNGKRAIDLAKVRGHSTLVDYINRSVANRKNQYCNIKSFLFGPVGNSKFIFYVIHLLLWFYQYPIYFTKVVQETWEDHFELNIAYVTSNIIMWILLYMLNLSDPGYLEQNTVEYQNYFRQVIFKSKSFKSEEWNRNLARLCHTCKTIKPLRASHCRACNRCVLAYDHHCPYIQNCVGYKNRPYFFLFVLTVTVVQIVTLRFVYIVMSREPYRYIYYPGAAMVVFFCLMGLTLFGTTSYSMLMNETSNEISKKGKYDYLRDSTGKKKNIFSKSYWYNVRYYFHLVEANYLETRNYEALSSYDV